MKLWHSLLKEIKLASRSFYFYMEVLIAGIFLFLLLFVIPENFDNTSTEYLYWDSSNSINSYFEELLLEDDLDNQVEIFEFELEDRVIKTNLYEADDKKSYAFESKDDMIAMAEKDKVFGAEIKTDEDSDFLFTYYMQGYETQRLLNTYAVFHNEEVDIMQDEFERQEVVTLHTDQLILSDRENIIPSILTFNGGLMGMFVLASYIFLDKKEGVIKAYAVTTSPVWQYLLSKIGVVVLTGILSSMIITMPIMGGQPNYLMLIMFLITSGFAASSVGLVIASYYDEMMKSFGTLYAIMMLLLLPNIAYFIPTWDPSWMVYIPTYSMLEAFKEIILVNGDSAYVLLVSLGYLLAGAVLFLFANGRFKKTLSV